MQDTVVCEQTPLRLHVRCENCDTWIWSDGSENHDLVVTTGGIYTVAGTNQCGTVADSINVKQIFCNIRVPNAFTPNGDGLNDVFRVLGNLWQLEHFSFGIYNRWGERVFYTSDKYAGWDGNHKGDGAPLGTYVYVLEYMLHGELMQETGSFHLLR
jgi:gliding motility-associated-like protein